MTQIDNLGYFSATESTESVAGGGYAQNVNPDFILAVSPQKTQACTGNKFATVGGAL